MIVDSEEQRSILLQALDISVPVAVQDATPKSLTRMRALAEARAAVQAAEVAEPAT